MECIPAPHSVAAVFADKHVLTEEHAVNDQELRIDHVPDERLREMARRELRDGLVPMLTRFAHDVSHIMECSYCGYRFDTTKQKTIAQARREQKRS